MNFGRLFEQEKADLGALDAAKHLGLNDCAAIWEALLKYIGEGIPFTSDAGSACRSRSAPRSGSQARAERDGGNLPPRGSEGHGRADRPLHARPARRQPGPSALTLARGEEMKMLAWVI